MLIVQLVDVPFALHVSNNEINLPVCKFWAEGRHVDGFVEIAPVLDDVDHILLGILPCVA